MYKVIMFITTIIVAAGRGKRFGKKKQFCNLRNKPVYLWSVEKFLPFSDEIILVLPKSDIARIKQQTLKHIYMNSANACMTMGNLAEIKFISGGKERSDSVKVALKHISSESEIVCIHDAVRPLINQTDISKCIRAAKKFGSAICATPATDTIKVSKGYNGNKIFIDRTLDRKKIWLAQTPQVFKKEIILKAYKTVNKFSPSDDAQLVEQLGYKVQIVPVTSPNIKITTKADLAIAGQLLKILSESIVA
ncbi:MAG: 2-C-methyl-D-erythritol 4-phosphate cytidylyltransferase [Elusimicrobiota bacterium]|nr:2-C-methyl-D-erythritol 4-phosphate cytidylyltransferase [Elusimicrobiota bacterium]